MRQRRPSDAPDRLGHAAHGAADDLADDLALEADEHPDHRGAGHLDPGAVEVRHPDPHPHHDRYAHPDAHPDPDPDEDPDEDPDSHPHADPHADARPPTDTPTPTPTDTPTPTPTTASPSVTVSPEPVPASSSTPWWPWALLAAVVVGLLAWLAVVLSKRRRWDADFERDLAESRWVVDHLVPQATDRTLPTAQVTQQWLDGKRRLDDLQSDLYRLGTAIPSSERATRLGALSGALGAVQESLQSDIALRGTASPDTLEGARELDASLQQVVHRRDALIAVVENRPTGPAHAAG